MIHRASHTPVRCVADDARTIGDLFLRRVRRSRKKNAHYEKANGRWEPTTWGGFCERAAEVAFGLRKHGIKPGDRVAILGPTTAQWAYFEIGCQLLGVVSIGVYPKQSVEQIRYLLEHSEAKLIFVSGETEFANVRIAVEDLKSVRAVVPWEDSLFAAHSESMPHLLAPTEFREAAMSELDIEEIQDALAPHDTAIFIYTSGTTGPPKGAMITHHNVVSVLRAQANYLEMYDDDLSLHFLPMAHAAERILGFYGRVNTGLAAAYASAISQVLAELKEVRPTLFGSVPRIFEKAYAKIQGSIEKLPRPARHVMNLAVRTAREAAPYVVDGREMPLALRLKWTLFDRTIYRAIRGAFGGRVRFFVTGAAPIAMEILEFFWGAGMCIFEVYGMTEATVVTHVNRPQGTKLGTVGQILSPLEHRIASDGEVLIKGPFVFKGYFKNPEATASTIQDGWLYTGDIGTIDSQGFLSITDRKKHIIITAGGKNLAPANIENAIKNRDALISQVHAHGDRRPYVSALVAPSPIETLELGVELNLVTAAELKTLTSELMADPSSRSDVLNASMAKVTGHPDFVERVRLAVVSGNQKLARVEQVRRFAILGRDFSQECGELTPTMKVKRKAIEVAHADLFDRIYNDSSYGFDASN